MIADEVGDERRCQRPPGAGNQYQEDGNTILGWQTSLPYAINADQGNLGGKIAFIFMAVMAGCAVFIFFAVPETKDRTYAEIDELWARRVAPRKFKQTTVVTVSDGDGPKGGVTAEHIA